MSLTQEQSNLLRSDYYKMIILTEIELRSFISRSIAERKQTAWDKFVKSTNARYNVAKIVQRVREEATLTFDFVTLILVAG